jgi:hypothetical protein
MFMLHIQYSTEPGSIRSVGIVPSAVRTVVPQGAECPRLLEKIIL